MRTKKGYFFTLDVVIATIVLAVGLYFVLSARNEVPYYTTSQYLSEDMITTFSSVQIRDISNNYIDYLVNDSNITNLDNTLMEQMGEFYYRQSKGCDFCGSILTNFTREVTRGIIPSNFDYAVLIKEAGDSYTLIYNSSEQNMDAVIVISSKRLASGIYNVSELWGPYVFEVRVWQ
ncbi:hypothetical protein HZB01_00485 [Candidatus Woesearchaeota archaeon]|nr:hypothetical protein [Candidatus Woesearchaeota archaeon]